MGRYSHSPAWTKGWSEGHHDGLFSPLPAGTLAKRFAFALSITAGTDRVGQLRATTDTTPEATVFSLDGIGGGRPCLVGGIVEPSERAGSINTPLVREVVNWHDDEGIGGPFVQVEGGNKEGSVLVVAGHGVLVR